MQGPGQVIEDTAASINRDYKITFYFFFNISTMLRNILSMI